MNRVLAGRTGLVTGAAGDIGRATAQRLAEAGASLVLADLPSARERLEETRQLCSDAASDGRATITVSAFDVTSAEEVEAALADQSGRGVTPDLLFNNAGFQGHFANVLDVSVDDVRRVLGVNVTGVFTVLQMFARQLRATTRSGSIVNMASMAGVGGAPNMAAYSASKAAVIGLTKSAAKDLAPFGIRVNSVSPAFIGPGAMWDNQVRRQAEVPSIYYGDTEAEVADQMIGQVPLRRYGSLDEVASASLFLLSDESSYITGFNLEVSGGVA